MLSFWGLKNVNLGKKVFDKPDGEEYLTTINSRIIVNLLEVGKIKKSKCLFLVLTIFLLFVSATSADIQLEGTWYQGGLLTQKNGKPDDFGYDNGVFTFEPNDSFTGVMTSDGGSSWSETGKAIPAEDGSTYMIFYPNELFGSGVWNVGVNSQRDVMVGHDEGSDWVSIEALVKKGSSYAITDLEGIWYSRMLKTQRNGYPGLHLFFHKHKIQ